MKNSKLAKILAGCIIASSILTTNAFAADNQKQLNTLSDAQKIQMEKEIKELPSKEKKVQDKIANQKNQLKDVKAQTAGVQSLTASTASYGTYPTRYGVILVTTDNTTFGIQHGHAGIVWTSTTTVESNTGGVCRMPNNWNTYYNTIYGVSPSSTTSSQDNDASNWCNSQVGKPYNYLFTDTSTRSRFYCSQLVWASFKDLFGVNLDDDGGIIWPVDLVNTKNTYILYSK